ncbi:Eco57I restriction-modification methylase domain-containing protein [Intestinibacter bartlettii]|uniref:Eco57I restriction-modification methylase domain-containing protein n=1 Tax=Intestinibacter bartlettii TaxID=261299 RepID=UPI001D113DB9|nr:TaqI-like C-terminal specificity domain-containing protein [Intestinibacter bartlettii]MCC2706064.1 Eco57I restriction-modification methylase domain-containing protein [Intestinibacter bartlettii]MCC2761514.1 Eco57I restriction-modification methylase domain-containing protein [Intestinibacter bartlettii]
MYSEAIIDIKDILREKFSEENFIHLAINLVNLESEDLLNSTYLNENSTVYENYVDYIKDIGKYRDSDRKTIVLSIVKLKHSPEKSRTMQRNFIAKHMKDIDADVSIVGLYSEDTDVWRISFVKLDYLTDIDGIHEELTSAKRYSYLIEPGLHNHTAVEQLSKLYDDNKKATLKDIENVFSVEVVTDEFFKMYKEKYLDLKELLEKDANFISEAQRLDIDIHDFSEEFAKKLMGQISFLYFLQKKGWLGVKIVPQNISKIELREIYRRQDEETRNIINKVYKSNNKLMVLSSRALKTLSNEDSEKLACSFKNTIYDDEWGTGTKTFIRTIFDTAINNEFNFFNEYLEPLFYNALNQKRGSTEYYQLFNCKIPFLNGGLFEPIYKYDWKNVNVQISNEFFSNKDKNGLLDLFDIYNFTINEDEPLEKEVAVDPEMLGKIFENLLEVKERRSKGAFYTPREIVHYMCQESLINYLSNEIKIPIEDIDIFIKYGEIIKDVDINVNKEENYKMPQTIINNLEKIDRALENVTIADPAVGSGAFPLGMLNEIVKARSIIVEYMTKDLNEWKKEDFIRENKRDLYNLKKNAMKKSIFAVDIEPSAVDITKLRLWLSLVVDSDVKTVNTLPNLDYNIMVGNSLVDEYEGIKLFDEELLKDKPKRRIEHKSSQIRYEFGKDNNLVGIGIEQEQEILEDIQNLQYELFEEKITKRKIQIKDEIENKEWELIEYKLLKDNKKEEFKKLEKTKKENRKPYFLWKMNFSKVFKKKGGFDIVIGNPPYVKEMNNRKVFEIVNKSSMGKKYHDGKMDFWYYFLHKAIEIKSTTGVINYITPSYWINSKGAYKLIKRISETLNFLNVVDIGKLKVFDTVVGYHMIAMYKDKKKCISDKFIYKKLQNNLNDINKNFDTDNINIKVLNNDNVINENFNICFENSDIDFSVYSNIGEFYDISQGVVEAIDKISNNVIRKYPDDNIEVGQGVFVLSKKELDTLMLNKKEKIIIKKYLNGSDVKRYKIYPNTKYLIYSNKEYKLYIEKDKDFVNIKKHLDKYKKYITSSNGPYGLHRPRKIKFFENKKLIFKSMFKKPEIALDNNGYYVGMSCSTIISKNLEFSLEALLGVLNSNLALYWFYTNGKKRGIGVDIGVQKLREFPIFDYDKIKIDKLERAVVEVMKYYEKEDVYNEKLEDYINKLVYNLYKLSAKDILKIEEFCKNI